jgi:hypothetical protein
MEHTNHRHEKDIEWIRGKMKTLFIIICAIGVFIIAVIIYGCVMIPLSIHFSNNTIGFWDAYWVVVGWSNFFLLLVFISVFVKTMVLLILSIYLERPNLHLPFKKVMIWSFITTFLLIMITYITTYIRGFWFVADNNGICTLFIQGFICVPIYFVIDVFIIIAFIMYNYFALVYKQNHDSPIELFNESDDLESQ